MIWVEHCTLSFRLLLRSIKIDTGNISIDHLKKIHACLAVSGIAREYNVMGYLLASVSLLSSPPLLYPRRLFDALETPDIYAMNNIVKCYAKGNKPEEAVFLYSSLFRDDIHPNNYTFPFLLKACSKLSSIFSGTQIHVHIMKMGFCQDLYICNALIHYYGCFHQLEEMKWVFIEMPTEYDVVSWNTILGGYVSSGQLMDARALFDELPNRDTISWSILIKGHMQEGYLEMGLGLFQEMRKLMIFPNEGTVVIVLSMVAQQGLLVLGRVVHSGCFKWNVHESSTVQSALVDMYAKCGYLELSFQVFQEMPHRGISVWNALICGLANHGFGFEALDLFQKFQSQSLKPDSVTFIGVLTACSHCGLVEEGRHLFKLMSKNYLINPEMEHYGCMIDLLGRAGFITEALTLMYDIVQPNPVLWGILLGACKSYGHDLLGETIGKRLIGAHAALDGHYVQLSSIYANRKKWDNAVGVRRLMLNSVPRKAPGWSLIES